MNIAARPRERETFRIVTFREPKRVLDLRLKPDEVRSRIKVPAGWTVGGTFDEEGNALALTKPIEIREGKTVMLAPSPPVQGTADLVVILQKRGSARPDELLLELSLLDGSARKPDFHRENESRLYAVWYGLAPSEGSIKIRTVGDKSTAHPVLLRSNRVSTMRLNHAVAEP